MHFIKSKDFLEHYFKQTANLEKALAPKLSDDNMTARQSLLFDLLVLGAHVSTAKGRLAPNELSFYADISDCFQSCNGSCSDNSASHYDKLSGFAKTARLSSLALNLQYFREYDNEQNKRVKTKILKVLTSETLQAEKNWLEILLEFPKTLLEADGALTHKEIKIVEDLANTVRNLQPASDEKSARSNAARLTGLDTWDRWIYDFETSKEQCLNPASPAFKHRLDILSSSITADISDWLSEMNTSDNISSARWIEIWLGSEAASIAYANGSPTDEQLSKLHDISVHTSLLEVGSLTIDEFRMMFERFDVPRTQIRSSTFQSITLFDSHNGTNCADTLLGMWLEIVDFLWTDKEDAQRVISRLTNGYETNLSDDSETAQPINLLLIEPYEFEQLIGILFSKLGFETTITKASGDGGIDCIAIDPRPMMGGKIIIQAKRYSGTVGVETIRELYGVMQHEGANKGIVVTTGNFSSGAALFARGKPIELVDGSTLLCHLRDVGINAVI